MRIKTKVEYIWLDGTKPEQKLRSKTKLVDLDTAVPKVEDLPEWSFDGSSTEQAIGSSSDCILRPVRVYRDPQRVGAYLALCEVLNEKGISHKTNERAELDSIDSDRQNEDWWFDNNSAQHIGGRGSEQTQYSDMYLTEVHHIDGQALLPSYFGYTDSSTGIWSPKKYTNGNYGN